MIYKTRGIAAIRSGRKQLLQFATKGASLKENTDNAQVALDELRRGVSLEDVLLLAAKLKATQAAKVQQAEKVAG